MSSISFICSVCKKDFPVSEKARKYKRCITCHKEKEKVRRILNFRDIEEYRERYKEKGKEPRKQYLIKKRNDKYGYTEEIIKEINDRWDKTQTEMKEFCKKYDHRPIIYKKEMTPKLKEIGMKSFILLKKWFENETVNNGIKQYYLEKSKA